MEKKYGQITKYLDQFQRDSFVEWSKQTGEGSEENPYSFPFIIYDSDVDDFIKEFYALGIDVNYVENVKLIEDKSIDDMTESELITYLTAIICGERFCDGLIESFFKDGSIQKILKKLDKF